MSVILALLLVLSMVASADAQGLPEGYAPLSETQPIIDKMMHVQLAPDLSGLTPAESRALRSLMGAGEIFQELHENMRHDQARESWNLLSALDRRLGSPRDTQNLLTIYYSASGPVMRGLDGVRRPVLPVKPPVPGGAVYPWDVTRAEIDAFLADHPDRRTEMLAPRTVVRRGTQQSIDRDLAALNAYREVADAFPDLRKQLLALARDPQPFYAVPYPVAYAEQITKASALIRDAADAMQSEDADFAGYLRARSHDLIVNDYAAGDSAWVSGHFKRLNAQIGSYETYDDALYGVKTYFSLNVLLRDGARSDALRAATRTLQSLEDSLPYDEGKQHKRVRTDIPVGVYDIIVDYAQSRGTNTASILPNDAEHARRYGRTILLRHNIMTNPDLFDNQRRSYAAVVDAKYAGDLVAEGNANRTLWHEIGHYLGVDRTSDGRDLDIALEQASDPFEEMKADLVSLYLVPQLRQSGYYDDKSARAVYASGVRRVLLKNQPERSQAYQTMELMQFNYFLSKGALSYDAKSGKLLVDYDKMRDAVGAMLRDVFRIQAAGDAAAAEAYIARWTEWREDLHEQLAAGQRDAETFRYTYVTYQAIENARQ